jgi:uncharacterized protein with HEPN domain
VNRDRVYLEHIQENILNVQRLANVGKESLESDPDRLAAVLYYLQTLAESTTHLSQALRDKHQEVPWKAVRGFRNRVFHDYLSVDLEIVWRVIVDELPVLYAAVVSMLHEFDARDDLT